MSLLDLPRKPADVLDIPQDRIPDVIREMWRAQVMSPLMRKIHADLQSGDPRARSRSQLALRRLGFPD